jgi:three-Cys-motif partner protein
MAYTHAGEESDDGLYYGEPVGVWAVKKYALVQMYNQMFATGMKKRWDKRIYIDLYAGPGKAKIRGSNRIVIASPLLALDIPDQYDRYIFCEKDREALEALESRVKRQYAQIDAHFVLGDSNEKIEEIVSLIPRPSRSQRLLSFCFIDPFSLEIEFKTITRLSKFFMDFLILLALAMDAKRNEARYVDPKNTRIEKFLGIPDWRVKWATEQQSGIDFRRFLAHQFARQMIDLGYRKESLGVMFEMRSEERNLPLYHLGFFSRHPKGYEFWREVRKYAMEPGLFE